MTYADGDTVEGDKKGVIWVRRNKEWRSSQALGFLYDSDVTHFLSGGSFENYVPVKPQCVFCTLIEDRKTVQMDVHSGVHYFIPLNPVTPGHILFVPYFHSNGPSNIGETFARAAAMAQSWGNDYNLIINQGKDAGQTVDHPHVHYVPRHENDGLVMPWTAQQLKDSV